MVAVISMAAATTASAPRISVARGTWVADPHFLIQLRSEAREVSTTR
jgi:hypothetical protein